MKAEPETCSRQDAPSQTAFGLASHRVKSRLCRSTHLVAVYADVIPVIHMCVDVEIVERIRDEEGVRFPLKLGPGNIDTVVAVAQILLHMNERASAGDAVRMSTAACFDGDRRRMDSLVRRRT